MKTIDAIHGGYVHSRRIQVLSEHLQAVTPRDVRVLDVGCGDGLLAAELMKKRPDVTVEGIDVLVREQTHIPVAHFNGETIPFAEGAFDVVQFVDVLHHTTDPMVLLCEAVRVARQAIVIKDHTRNGLLANATLRFMDQVGNARYGVALPYNYWPERRWRDAFAELGLSIGEWRKTLSLYPAPADWIFGRSLHFIARLDVAQNRCSK